MTATQNPAHSPYWYPLLLSSLVFAAIHSFQMLGTGLVSQHSWRIDPSGFLVLLTYAVIEVVSFFAVGYVVGYFPVRLIFRFLENNQYGRFWYAVSGAIVGALFLPVCAGIAFYLITFPDEPDYFSRCVEYFLPMVLAGAFGGLVFWHSAHRKLSLG